MGWLRIARRRVTEILERRELISARHFVEKPREDPARSRWSRAASRERLIVIQIFFRDVIFRYFTRTDFLFFVVTRFFHTGDDAGFKGISFFQQLVNTFGSCAFSPGQTLQIDRKSVV